MLRARQSRLGLIEEALSIGTLTQRAGERSIPAAPMTTIFMDVFVESVQLVNVASGAISRLLIEPHAREKVCASKVSSVAYTG